VMWKWLCNMWKHRKVVRSPENYAAFVQKCSADQAVAGRVRGGQQAGAYPDGPDGGWRYQCKRLPMHDKLSDAYQLHAVAGKGNTFERALRLMDWLAAHTWYCGMRIYCLPDNGLKTLRYAFDKPFRRAINCRHKAIALSDCLMAVGIAAIPVCIIRRGPGAAFI